MEQSIHNFPTVFVKLKIKMSDVKSVGTFSEIVIMIETQLKI